MKFIWKCMGLSQDSRRQKESCHNIDNKFFVKIWAPILRATEAMAFHVSIVKNSPSETNKPGVGPCRRRQNKWNQHVERTSQRQLRLATCWPEIWHVWQVLHQHAPGLSLESEIGQTMCKISTEQMSRFKLMQQLKYWKSLSRKVASLVPSRCSGNIQPSALFKTPTVVMFSLLIYLWALYSLQRCFTYMALFLTVNSICTDLSLSNFQEIKQWRKWM